MKQKIWVFCLIAFLVSCTEEMDSLGEVKETASSQKMEIVLIDEDGKNFTGINECEIQTKGSEENLAGRQTNFAIRFKDEVTFKTFMSKGIENDNLSLLRSEIQKEYPELISLLDIYHEAMEWSDQYLDETAESYQSWKKNYGEYLYFPEYKEDYGAYLPVSNLLLAAVSNSNCNVVVGDQILNTRDIYNYNDLQIKGSDAYYSLNDEILDSEKVATRAAMVDHEYRLMGSFSNCNEEYDSGWEEKNNRKLRVKVGRQVGGNGIRIHIEISFRKKGILGWSNYSSETNSEFTYRGTTYAGLKKTANSSHDWYFDDKIYDGSSIQSYYKGDVNTKLWMNYINAKPWSISIVFRGFGEQYAGYKFQRSGVIPYMKFYWPI